MQLNLKPSTTRGEAAENISDGLFIGMFNAQIVRNINPIDKR